MSERPRAYRFKTAAQWQACILHGIDAGRDGVLQPIARLGSTARELTKSGPVSLVAADLAGGPVWRLDLSDRHVLLRRTALDETSRPFALGDTLAHAFRWILDRHSLWAFDADSSIVRRFERDTLQEDLAVDLLDVWWPAPAGPITIRDIAGDELFNEVWFTDARVPADCRLGEEGQGWQVAMGTLGHERVGTAGLAITMAADLRSMISAAKATNPEALRDPEIRERIARAFTDIEYTKLLNYRALTKIIKGEKNWPEVPLAKLQWSYLAQTLAELAVDLLGPAGLLTKGGPDAVDGGTWARLYSFQRYTTIGAGATEVQKNIIADRALLPRK